ncbi:hypothetical protein BDZ89DRAFT_954869 [Hymenopellis radicata]|nr:hypothetical protein BDZ89DRAFT_954869 [Hymenopellis radicata]
MHRCEICKHDFPRLVAFPISAYCILIFCSPSGLRTHMNSHNGIRPFPCTFPGCEKTFGVRSNMKRHLRTHGPPPAEMDYWQLEYPHSSPSTPQSVHPPDSAIRTTQSWSPPNAFEASFYEAGYSSSEYDEMDNTSNGSYSGIDNVQLLRRNAMVPPSDSELEVYNQKTSFPFSRVSRSLQSHVTILMTI